MTITATADVGFVPPRVEVDVSVPSGNVMTSVSVWRNDSSGRSLVRSQPSAGFDERTVFDYECPYGQVVTYDWAAEYYDPANLVTTFSEPWSVFPSSWTGDTGRGGIASNRLTMTPIGSAQAIVSRLSVAFAWNSITVDYLSGGVGGSIFSALNFVSTSPSSSMSFYESGGNVHLQTTLGGINTGVPASAPFTITRGTSTVITGSVSGSYTLPQNQSGTIIAINIGSNTGAATAITVGAITVQEIVPGDVETIAETSAPVTLDPDDAWLIAPQSPALSVPLSNSNQQAAGIRTLGPVSNASNTTIHRILGTSTPVTTTTGNRQNDTLSATVYTHTSEERQNLKALLAPDTPILINVPPAWDLELDYGYYQVGDVTETRPYTLGGIPMRDFQLPLTRVRSPEVDVENPGWSYAQLATTWATYTELLTNYATYADLAADNRS